GGTMISAGTLQLGNGGVAGSIVGDVVNNGILAINRSNAFLFDGAISGSGAFQQNGAGATTLSNANTYTGPTSVNLGTLIIGAVANNTNGLFNVAAGLTIGGTFDNAAGGTLAIASTGVALVQGLLTNSGAIAVADMGQLDAAAGIANKASGAISVGKGGVVHD